MINDLASEDRGAAVRGLGLFGGLRRGLRRIVLMLGLGRPSFAEKVDTFRRGTAEERRWHREAQRRVDGIERGRRRLQIMARRLSDGGIATTVKFWPVAYKTAVDRKDRKFGFAELRGVIMLSTQTPSGRQTTSLPVTVSSMRDAVSIQPSFAMLQESGQKNAVIDLFLEFTAISGNTAERVFCEGFEDALAKAIAAGRIAL